MLITTTNSIENAEIEQYLGVISANLVVGTNFFSDFAASFTDLFGGMSGTYQEKLDTLYRNAMNELSQKATSLGANSIIGVGIDFDEVSGKGKSMFMISIVGTAVRVNIKNRTSMSNEKTNTISSDYLKTEFLKAEYLTKFETYSPTKKDWEFIMSHDMPELAPTLFKLYIQALAETPSYEKEMILNKLPIYLNKLDYNDAVKVVYYNWGNIISPILGLIRDLKLFNADEVLRLIDNGNIDEAIAILEFEKSYYTSQDLESMKKILSALDSLPDIGRIEEVKGGLLSKGGLKYICPKGHKNPVENKFCEDISCRLNIKGLVPEQIESIKRFKQKVDILENLLNK